MQLLAFDTETALIRPGVSFPEVSCLSYQTDNTGPKLIHQMDAESLVRSWFQGSDTLFVGHNVAFDMGVLAAKWPDLLPEIFRAYGENRVTDTMLRQKLLDIASGTYRGKLGDGNVWVKYDYSLQQVAHRVAGIYLEKDEWRLRYGEFIDVPISEWPEGARHYPKQDAFATWQVYQLQEVHARFLKDQYRQARADWFLKLASAWGLRTDLAKVEQLEQMLQEEFNLTCDRLQKAGLYKRDKKGKGSQDKKAAADYMVKFCEQSGLPLRRTKGGGVSLDSDACGATEDPVLLDYAAVTSLGTLLSKDISALKIGVEYPIHTLFNLAETGRATSSKPNVQNWARGSSSDADPEWKKNCHVRECFVPRPGHVFVSADYSGLELCTLSEACISILGRSKLGEVINQGLDPHLLLAAEILHIPYAEALLRKKEDLVDNARQTAKVANFGFPGGLGAAKLCLFARKTYGVDLTEEEAKQLKNNWLTTWPEMREYFAFIKSLFPPFSDRCSLEQIRSGRVRGGCYYTKACNSFFQGLGADATKHAGWLLAQNCYINQASPLYGSRIVNYVHDEFILETALPDMSKASLERVNRVAHELSRVMVEGAREWLPNVTPKAEPLLMSYWSKKAKPVKNEDGLLIPWCGT